MIDSNARSLPRTINPAKRKLSILYPSGPSDLPMIRSMTRIATIVLRGMWNLVLTWAKYSEKGSPLSLAMLQARREPARLVPTMMKKFKPIIIKAQNIPPPYTE
jgi:hypothetical protein